LLKKSVFRLLKTLPILMAGFAASAPAGAASRFMMPQKKPAIGPWYEGWYIRVTDPSGFSFGTISTSHTPKFQRLRDSSVLPGYVAFLYKEPKDTATKSVEFYPERTHVAVEEEHFTWTADGFGNLSDRAVDFKFPQGEEVSITFGDRKPWSEMHSDWGPAGPATFIPFAPMFWYVDSIGTPVKYRVKVKGGRVYEGQGYAHVEKNWGRIFPRAWMWLQAVAPANDAYVALAGGPLGIKPAELTTFFIGYKTKNIDIEIRPDKLARYDTVINAKEGYFRIDARTLRDRIVIESEADPASFAPVSIPTPRGYEPNGGVESFSAVIKVSAYRDGTLLEERRFANGALEFGADYQESRDPR
jgi:hypothetical protein